jgi:hypothetical protein
MQGHDSREGHITAHASRVADALVNISTLLWYNFKEKRKIAPW